MAVMDKPVWVKRVLLQVILLEYVLEYDDHLYKAVREVFHLIQFHFLYL